MGTKSITFRTDEQTKEQAEKIFAEIGIPLATAINIFLRKTVSYGGFPFELRVEKESPNIETIQAMLEADNISRNPNAKTYQSFSELLNEIEAEE